jgi:hypothetical protein
MTWDVLEEAWTRAWREARAWQEEHGHLEVPEGFRTAEGTRLATWLGHQRKALREGTATPWRAELLGRIGLGPDAAAERWARRYRQLAAAMADSGGRGLEPGSPEATWLENQRAACRAGRLPEDKIALLRDAGVVLRRSDLWDAAYRQLAAFHAAHGHTRVPRRTLTPAGTDLGTWVTTQRQRKSRLTTEQIALLEKIGFSWDSRDDAWHARYAEAAAFRDQHGHLAVTFHTPLGAWLYQQRKKHRGGKLTPGQEKLLTDIGALDDPDQP